MREGELLLPQLVALAGGTLAVRFAFPTGRAGWIGALGYGYIVGLVFGAAGLYISAMAGFGVRFWPAVAIQGALCVLLAFVLRGSRRGDTDVAGSVAPVSAGSVGKWLAIIFAALLLFRLVVLGLEATAQPLYPWDAWQQWGTKARVWFETHELRPFASPDAWLQASPHASAGVYTDANPAYPPLVPLIQVWTLGTTSTWNDAILGVTWLGLYCALGLGFAWQLYRMLPLWPFAFAATYAVLSLPFLGTHVALAGYADFPLSVIYCFAFMAAISWAHFRRRGDAALAVAFILMLPFFKRPGIAWALTFVPFLSFAIPAVWRALFIRGVIALAGLAGVGLIVLHAPHLDPAEGVGALWSVVLNLFAWENWHLLWYVAILVLVLRRERMKAEALQPAAATLALGAIFLVTVFWGTELSASIADVTTLNRALLPLTCATCYFLALLVAPDIRKLVGSSPVVPAVLDGGLELHSRNSMR